MLVCMHSQPGRHVHISDSKCINLVKYHVVFGKPRDFDSQVCLLWLPAAMKENKRRIMFSTLK